MRYFFLFLCLPSFALTKTFTLEEAISYALLHNHILKAEDKQIEMKEEAVWQKVALARPKLFLKARSKHVNREISFSLLGQPLSFSSRTQHQAQFEFYYPVYQFGKEDIEIDVARREAQVEELERQRMEREVTLEIKKSFYQLYLADRLVRLAQQEVKQAQEFLAITEKKVLLGQLPSLEKMRAQVHLKEKEREKEIAWNNRTKAEATLKQQMGYSLTENFDIALELKEPLLPDLREEKCVQQAFARRPELRRLHLERKNAEDGILRAKKASFPETQFFFNYLLEKGSSFATNFRDTYEFGLLFHADIFDGGIARSKVRELHLQVENLSERMEDVREKIALEVGLRILDVQEAFTQLQLMKEQKFLARELLQIQESRFENGFGLAIEVLDAQNRLHSAEIGWEKALTDYYIALEALENASGGQCW